MCLQKCFSSGAVRNVIFGSGLLFVMFAISCNLFWTEIVEYAVKKELQLSDSSKSFSLWLQNPIPLYIDFYFFNWTNPSDLKQPDYKPKFEEVGPYRFREEVKKIEIKWNENHTVTYRKLRRWYFEKNESGRNLTDVITTVNIIASTAARSTKYWNRISRIPVSVTLGSTQEMTLSKPVKEFLFEGFSHPLIDLVSKIPTLSSRVPFDRFGWFYKRNDSSDFDGVFNIGTGADEMENLGKVKFWNFNSRTPFYKGRCGEVKGSAGDFWPPPTVNTSKITLFSPDMCRYIDFLYTKKENVGDIKGNRYESGVNLLDNGTTEAENGCFCGGRCLPSGVVNVSSCRFGAPAFVSYPHFYLADSFYLTSIDGLTPEAGKHDNYIILDQKWGIPLEVAIRLQINVLIESDPGIRMFDGVRTTVFPMMWFEQKVTISEHMREEIKTLLDLPRLGFITSVVCYVAGLFCLVFYAFSRCEQKRRKALR